MPLVADAETGFIQVIHKLGSGSEMFVIGIKEMKIVGAIIIITRISNSVMAQHVIVLSIFPVACFFVPFFLRLFFLVLASFGIYVCVSERASE